MNCRFEFKLQDCWIGVYWQRKPNPVGGLVCDVWICVLPCCPLHLSWYVPEE